MNRTQQDVLAIARDTAQRATIVLHGLMAVHGITSPHELHLLLQWPAGMKTAHAEWMASMVALVNVLAHNEGIENANHLSEKDKVRLTHQAYDLVMS